MGTIVAGSALSGGTAPVRSAYTDSIRAVSIAEAHWLMLDDRGDDVEGAGLERFWAAKKAHREVFGSLNRGADGGWV